jgi:hypothetical protein
MSRAREVIERGLARYQELVGEIPGLEEEFLGSQEEFFAAGAREGADQVLAPRRHLEWFLLERPSPFLGGVPAQALRDEWRSGAEDDEEEHEAAFLQSHAGAFEITSSEAGRGLWVRDLFGLGEYPVEEPEAALELQPGDLLVGRLFPVGDALFALSPAVSCFRNPGLVLAVRDDLERLRKSRRGVLRIQQIELERLFFSSSPATEGAEAPDLASEREHARTELRAAGLAEGDAEDALALVARAASEERSVVTELLNRLAFETDIDLERTRRALIELWAAESRAVTEEPAGAGLGGGPTSCASAGGAERVSADGTVDSLQDVRSALEAFERGRAAGGDLEGLFRQLAEELGVDVLPEGDESELPDFPGVVGAMVEEFLWDVGRERGAPTAERLGGIRLLARFGSEIGVFENLGRRDLLDFGGRWLLDEGALSGAEEARAVLDALEEFCRWCEERHAHPLWTESGELIEKLAQSVPRLVVARQRTAPPSGSDRPWQVLAVSDDELVLRRDDGEERRVPVPARLDQLFRAGDLVHARTEGDDFLISSSYPAELRELLER